MKLFFVPDAVDSAGGSSSTGSSDTPSIPADMHTRHKANVPDKAVDLSDVTQKVAVKWKSSPFITLVWKTQGDFESDSSKFGVILTSRLATGST